MSFDFVFRCWGQFGTGLLVVAYCPSGQFGSGVLIVQFFSRPICGGRLSLVQFVRADLRSSNFLVVHFKGTTSGRLFFGAGLRSSNFWGRPSVVQFLGADLRSSIFTGRPSVVQFFGADLRSSNFWGPTFCPFHFFYQNFIFLSIFHFFPQNFFVLFSKKIFFSNFFSFKISVVQFFGADLWSSNLWGWPSVVQSLGLTFGPFHFFSSKFHFLSIFHFFPQNLFFFLKISFFFQNYIFFVKILFFDIYLFGLGNRDSQLRNKISMFVQCGLERHLVVGNVYIYTLSDSVNHGGNFDLYMVGLWYVIKSSIFGRCDPLERPWAPPSG